MYKLNLALCFIFLLSGSAIADTEKNNCKNAPKKSLLKLKPPYDSWFKIDCDAIRKSHFITAQKGYKWKEKVTGKSYSFNAFGPISPKSSTLSKNIYEPHKYYFLKDKAVKMRAKEVTNTNKLLPEGHKEYKEIHQLDVLTSTKTIYNFFIFVENNTPEWIVACVNYSCKRSATIKVNK